MKLKITLLLLSFIAISNVQAQELQWKTGLNYFFDNSEFLRSTLTNDYTVAGVHLTPEVGTTWDLHHGIFGGIDLMKQSGSRDIIDKATLLAYYQYKSPKTIFYAGAFPRNDLFSNYSEFFFQDSISFFRPVIQGLYVKHGNRNGYINFWLDWDGLRTAENRESFFVGISGYKKLNLFFLDFQSYMYHYANTQPSNPAYNLFDNLQGQISGGINLSGRYMLTKMIFSAGVLAGYERDRANEGNPYTPIGAVLNAQFGYKAYGIDFLYYGGNPRMKFYDKHGANVYWGTPLLKGNNYLLSKVYVNIIRNRFVNGQLNMKIHLSEGKLFFEQQFLLSASLDSFSKKTK